MGKTFGVKFTWITLNLEVPAFELSYSQAKLKSLKKDLSFCDHESYILFSSIRLKIPNKISQYTEEIDPKPTLSPNE